MAIQRVEGLNRSASMAFFAQPTGGNAAVLNARRGEGTFYFALDRRYFSQKAGTVDAFSCCRTERDQDGFANDGPQHSFSADDLLRHRRDIDGGCRARLGESHRRLRRDGATVGAGKVAAG